MEHFFQVTELGRVFTFFDGFPEVGPEIVSINNAHGRIIYEDITAGEDIPGFSRSTMDGYAVKAASTFGASEGNPAYLSIKGSIGMGETPRFSIGPGEASGISTGGMLPEGGDAVVMIEHTEKMGNGLIEVYKSVAPGSHVIAAGEDFRKSETVLGAGRRIRAGEMGLLAALGRETVEVYRKPVVGIISTGDEIVPIHETPGIGKIRDVNTYSLSGFLSEAGAIPICFDIVRDDCSKLFHTCESAIEQCDMVLISGGSSVGTRDFTIKAISGLPDAEILVHGISISPGKPTILARVGKKAFWGLPGHVTSAMVVFLAVVRPCIEKIAGQRSSEPILIPARINRNIASAQGRTDFIRVGLEQRDDGYWAKPILGKSGLLNTMVHADGLVEIGLNVEGLEKGDRVSVIPV